MRRELNKEEARTIHSAASRIGYTIVLPFELVDLYRNRLNAGQEMNMAAKEAIDEFCMR